MDIAVLAGVWFFLLDCSEQFLLVRLHRVMFVFQSRKLLVIAWKSLCTDRSSGSACKDCLIQSRLHHFQAAETDVPDFFVFTDVYVL